MLHVPTFREARVLVAGDLMLDRYWHGPVSRISPEAPVPVVQVERLEERPGGAGNVAFNIATLGAQASVVGVTGDDDAADRLEQLLSARGVQCRFQRQAACDTIAKLRVISRHQQLMRLDFEDGFPDLEPAVLLARLPELLNGNQVLVLSDYGKGTLRPVQRMIEIAHTAGVKILVDPKSRDFDAYRSADVITPNLAEFEAVAGPCRNAEELSEKGMRLLEKKEIGALLITRGEHGMTLLQQSQPAVHLPTRAREVYDVTGAGDTVIAVLACAIAVGMDLQQATALANAAAGIVVGKLGTAAPSLAELRGEVEQGTPGKAGLLTRETLLQLVAEARHRGERLVVTNGCFDILHAGHVSYLQQARRLGDRLIVALNDDASVQRLKGVNRPINSLEQRAAVLNALECVDWLVAFGDDTPEDLICAIRPDVLVKGGDYRPDEIAGADCVTDHGGKVVILDYLEGHSTSAIIDSIRKPRPGDDQP